MQRSMMSITRELPTLTSRPTSLEYQTPHGTQPWRQTSALTTRCPKQRDHPTHPFPPPKRLPVNCSNLPLSSAPLTPPPPQPRDALSLSPSLRNSYSRPSIPPPTSSPTRLGTRQRSASHPLQPHQPHIPRTRHPRPPATRRRQLQ